MADCVFCAIAAGESPAHRVFEDEETLAFLDAAPAARGHTLVIPKAHAETITDVPEALVGEVFRTAQRVATALEDTYEPDGISVVQSNGRAAGQEVPHAHVHVVPRSESDDVGLNWDGQELDDDTQRATAATLREQFHSNSG